MKKLWTSNQFIELLVSVTKIPTVYMSSGTLSDVTTSNMKTFKAWCPSAWKSGRVEKCIKPVLDKGTHLGADCSNLFKGLVWGWNPNGVKRQPNGAGVIRGSNGLKDINSNLLFNTCEEISSDMSNILPGEMVWTKGHIGMYYGKIDNVDYVIDSTVSLNGVKLNKMSRQKWKKHGKFPWVDYKQETTNDVLYRVQVGEYRVKSDAEAIQKQLIKQGYDALIVTK